VYIDAERFENVGAAAAAKVRAIAVFGDLAARAGGDKSGDGRDVKRAHAVTAGAARVDDIRRADTHRRCCSTRGAHESRDFRQRLALHAQRDQQCPDLRRRGLARHQAIEHRGGLRLGQVAASDEVLDGFVYVHGVAFFVSNRTRQGSRARQPKNKKPRPNQSPGLRRVPALTLRANRLRPPANSAPRTPIAVGASTHTFRQ
jgi:hypothetical protein